MIPTKDGNVLMFIEMKKRDGVPSDIKTEQLECISALQKCKEVIACVCFGWDQARDKIERMIS